MKSWKKLTLLTTLMITTAVTPAQEVKADSLFSKIIKELSKNNKDIRDLHRTYEGVKSIKKEFDKLKQPTNTIAKDKIVETLAADEFVSGESSIEEINGGKATISYKWVSEEIDYSPLDNYNRVGQATAYLSKKNLGKSEGRSRQMWKPTGWHNQKRNVNRGHLIAYTLSFNFDENGNYSQGMPGSEDNPLNLFTQTEFSNQHDMQIFEEQVRDTLKTGEKVVYQVTPIFRGNELMARGVWVQAVSERGSLNFNAYLHNVQEGFTFDYKTGRSVKSDLTVQGQ